MYERVVRPSTAAPRPAVIAPRPRVPHVLAPVAWPHRLGAASSTGTIQRVLDAAGQLAANEDTFDEFLTANNIDERLATFNGLNSLRSRYLDLRNDTRRVPPPHNAGTIVALNTRHTNLVNAGLAINANLRANAWDVGDVVENNRFELTLTWRGHLGGNKTVHCSFRHLLTSYLEARYGGNPLNTIAYCDYSALKRGMTKFARHLKQAMEAAADGRTLTNNIANTYDAGGDLKFEADNGFNPGATELHCYAIATDGMAATIGQDVFNSFTIVLAAYRTYATSGRVNVLETDAVQNNWYLIKDNAEIKAIFEGGGFWHELDRLIAPEDENLFGLRLLG